MGGGAPVPGERRGGERSRELGTAGGAQLREEVLPFWRVRGEGRSRELRGGGRCVGKGGCPVPGSARRGISGTGEEEEEVSGEAGNGVPGVTGLRAVHG